jgi:DNA-binding transcriptional LysR family regulator
MLWGREVRQYTIGMEKTCFIGGCRMLDSPPMANEFNVDQIKKLWVLDLIIRCGSLKKAALQAKVSPSAVSQSLSSLEQAVGKPLVVRERGTVTPTPEAMRILGVVRPAFDAFARLRQEGPAPKISWLNFGTYESLAVEVLPGLIRSLREKLPHLRLGLRVSRTSSLLTMLRKGELCSVLAPELEELSRFFRAGGWPGPLGPLCFEPSLYRQGRGAGRGALRYWVFGAAQRRPASLLLKISQAGGRWAPFHPQRQPGDITGRCRCGGIGGGIAS